MLHSYTNTSRLAARCRTAQSAGFDCAKMCLTPHGLAMERYHFNAKVSTPVMQPDEAPCYLEGSAPRPVAPPSHQGSNEERIYSSLDKITGSGRHDRFAVLAGAQRRAGRLVRHRCRCRLRRSGAGHVGGHRSVPLTHPRWGRDKARRRCRSGPASPVASGSGRRGRGRCGRSGATRRARRRLRGRPRSRAIRRCRRSLTIR